ncbi:MAG: non-lysosomal glucosylceramidase [Acidobacteriota bacterium]|nr:non-lysosomal glucosylceramidase [Acidobacteriota bacterium]
MIAFPLGGVGAGSVSLGGRGQLRDWEIFNKAEKGNNLSYALPSIWVKAGNANPVARVLEARYQPPYEGQNGLGSRNAPGLSRIASARFTGEFPLARIDFEDDALPVRVSLEAFTPFIPHNPDDSGLPVAVLRYTVVNQSASSARVSIAWSIDNPVSPVNVRPSGRVPNDTRVNEFRGEDRFAGILMSNPGLASDDLLHGTFALAVLQPSGGKLTYLRGWPRGRWWNSPMLFWDDFSSDGELGPEPPERNAVGAVCFGRDIPARGRAEYAFLLAWHFPNRTPARCGWTAPKGEENTVIGNWYSTKFPDAWAAAEYTAANLARLEKQTRLFAAALRESTVPAAIREAASANLSTFVTTTCFRTADGEFHGFEGANDKLGCCFGNCTHVWNYETATAHLFPSLSRSLRKAAFGYSMDDAGAMHFRQVLPDGKERSGFAAADGQMGQIVHAHLDWILSGDEAWLRQLWPRIRKGLEFAWVPGGWDANRDGVMEGVQHNTYDVEFYGPNPQCGIYYLAALRAAEEMARAVGDNDFAQECRRLFESGKKWIDANLFNGEFYIQQVVGYRNDQIAPSLRSSMGADDPQHPEFQVGKGCLVDQLVGQYLAEVCGLGPLADRAHVRKALESIHRYNRKSTLYNHNSVQRTFALNDESALVICDYGKAERPRIPFPYYAEVMTGFEHSAAAHMIFAGMVAEGLESVADIRKRYDGERRNPWDEAECGHHYARAMASWSSLLAVGGFRYRGTDAHVTVIPKIDARDFRCFWSTATGWGVFTRHASRGNTEVAIRVHSGQLPLRSAEFVAGNGTARVSHRGEPVAHQIERENGRVILRFRTPVLVREGEDLAMQVNT